MLTEKDLYEMCEEICERIGQTFDIPVKINKRLTSTLGRVKYIQEYNMKISCVLMEFSYLFLTTASLDAIKAVVEHECAHYLITKETNERHKHDAMFKEMCERIGCTNDKTRYDYEKITEDKNIYKYFVTCDCCNKIVGKYHRAGKMVQHPNLYICKCGGSLTVTQNF